MKRNKNKSEVSLTSVKSVKSVKSVRSEKSEQHCKDEIYVPPLDVLNIKILDFTVPDEDPKPYALKISFFDQLLLSSIVTSSPGRELKKDKRIIAEGYMNYDPSDYEKMCLFADNPLTIKIHPFKSTEANVSCGTSTTGTVSQSNKSSFLYKSNPDVYACNIDILPIFIDRNEMVIKKRLEPIITLPALQAKSWDNFPQISLIVNVDRNIENEIHHQKFKKVNHFKLTLVGCYNLLIPFDDKSIYTAATKLPLSNEMNFSNFTFNSGYRLPKRFDDTSFYPHWESLRLQDDCFTIDNEKLQYKLEDLYSEYDLDIQYYLKKSPKHYATVWASFHRTLLLKDKELWLSEHIRRYNWPLEVHIYGEDHGFSFMGFIDLFKLLYPGEKKARLVVPLQWIDSEIMMEKCGCELLLAPNKPPSTDAKSNRDTSEPTCTSAVIPISTGSDGNSAFVILEVTLARPFKKPIIPPIITPPEINDMLLDMELLPTKRECTGRGQLDRDWQSTVRNAANSLRRVPYYGPADMCVINRQLSESRTRVELVTSFWQEAAIYVNNNFILSEFLQSDDTYEEMLMIAHACLMGNTHDILIGDDNIQELNPTLRAARHARQLQNLPHAMDLYLQLIAENSKDANNWRELATCLRDIDKDWANVCINKSILLNPRHPLSLLSKGCMIFEDDPDAAEPFFLALLGLYPFWATIWVAANAYYLHRELFHIAHSIMEQVNKMKAEGLVEDMCYPRSWERELGDWWYNTPLLPGTSLYYDAADLLLRIRGVSLAEVCIACALSETGESPVYYHMVSLCCRLKGQVDDALCFLKQGIERFGEICYLRTLEGECFHKKKELGSSIASFEKAGSCGSPYITLLSLPRRDHQRTRLILSDLVRRHPSAYAWIAFAEDWVTLSTVGEGGDADATEEQRSAISSAANCALKALKCDRRAGRAWALLASLLSPSARRQYCKEMATMCDYNKPVEDHLKPNLGEKDSFCYRLGKAIRECRCKMCENLVI